MVAPTVVWEENKFFDSLSRPYFAGGCLWGFCAILSPVLPVTVDGSPVLSGVIFFAPELYREGVIGMITWTELLAFGMFVIALISLSIQIIDNKKK